MEYITLNTGAKMPLEGFGVFQIPDQSQCEEVTYNAIKTGYRLIDTAAAYMNEEAVGKAVVESIADKTGGDLYEVTPSDPYTDDDLDWTNDSSRVNREHNDESLQDVKFDSYDIPNFDSYDTVFVGYPIWWGDASWVMKSFVKNVDFSGKTVIPFCTSSSSGIGDSGKNLAKTAGTGNWLDGQRFSENASADEVGSWVDSLNL